MANGYGVHKCKVFACGGNMEKLVEQDKTFVCKCCEREFLEFLPGELTSNYGVDDQGNYSCLECCADHDVEYMFEHRKWVGYFVEEKKSNYSKFYVTNWPGTLKFPVTRVKDSWHNFGITRTDFWFNGPDGHVWHGYNIGSRTQIAHCKRTKKKWAKPLVSE